jgi:predicted DNA-binding protein YlxM (UPF0122 family)
MHEKNLNIGYLLDFYGELLSDRKRSVMEMYYNEDFSLSEIADEIGISRQGVRDIIKKSEEELFFFEEKLGLSKKLKLIEDKADDVYGTLDKYELPEDLKNDIVSLVQLIKQ